MFGFTFLAFWFLSWLTGDDQLALWLLIGGFVAYFLLLLVLDVRDLQRFWGSGRQRQLTQREQELVNAGRGAGLLALLALALSLTGWPQVDAFLTAALTSPDLKHGGVLLAVGLVAALGLIMFLTAANRVLRAAGERDVRLISWALLRLSLGSALWWVFWQPPAAPAPWILLAHALPYSDVAVTVLALWLVVTGGVRLFFILWDGERAERIIRRILERRNEPLRPARWRRG
jgi:hypothetical protein